MSIGVEGIRERMRDYLAGQGVNAVTAWPSEPRRETDRPVVVVSLRECREEPAGFQNYLGERYDREKGLWEECYGKKAVITFGLDLYAPAWEDGRSLQTALDGLLEALTGDGPAGLAVQEVVCGETEYDRAARLQVQKVRAVCIACLYAVERPGEGFLDFELRGGVQK